MEKVLAISAHCDDVELGMGGTLLKHRDAGDEITIAVLNADEALTGFPKVRWEEQRKSCEILKAKDILMSGKGPVEEKVGILDEIKPTVLYYPWEKDSHQDHVVAAQVGFAVARNVRIRALRYIATTSHSYYPTVLNVIDMEEKKKLVSVFASQMQRRPKFMEIMEAQNRFFGSLIPGNGHFSEGFVLFRMVQL